MLIAAGNQGGTVLKQMLSDRKAVKSNISEPQQFILRLARLATASPDDSQRTTAIEALLSADEFTREGLTGILSESSRRSVGLESVREKLPSKTRQRFDAAISAAIRDAGDNQQPEGTRRTAIGLVAYTAESSATLLPIALRDTNQGIRLASIAALTKGHDAAPWRALTEAFARETPAIQRAIIDGLLSDSDRISILFDAIAAGTIKPTAVDPIRAKQLLTHKDKSIRERAKKALAAAIPPDREKVLAEYRACLELKADAARGRAAFEKRCAVCHKIGDVGIALAPDISDSRERTPLQLLTDILQPNRAIDSNFFSFTLVTKDGRTHTGVLGAETSTSVTLRQQENKTEVVSRGEIEELYSNGVSYMPEGLEKDISKQEMADLISFIKNWRYLENPQEFVPK
jgi:putative heme-binding domain-containing protein